MMPSQQPEQASEGDESGTGRFCRPLGGALAWKGGHINDLICSPRSGRLKLRARFHLVSLSPHLPTSRSPDVRNCRELSGKERGLGARVFPGSLCRTHKAEPKIS